jgi:hypothetical protein
MIISMNDAELTRVLLDQRQELELPPPGGRWVRRTAEAELRAAMARPLMKVIMGPRRAGKSVLARLVLGGSDYAYVNFDDERLSALTMEDLQRVEQSFASLWPRARTWFLDEVQNVPGWELFVNRLQRLGYNLLITGSNSKLLGRELATHLTGRYLALELFPFSFGEVLEARGVLLGKTTAARGSIVAQLDLFRREGGFPEMTLFGYSAPYLRELHDKIVTRDIATRHQVRYSRTLKELALYSASNPATRITYNSVQRTFSLRSVHTAKSYLHYLEEAYLVFLVPPFAFRFREQIKQARKVYTIDNGLTAALSTKITDDRGASLENLVCQELRRRGLDLFTWSRPDGDVDFLIREGRRVSQLIQVCAALDTEEVVSREYRGLYRAAAATRCRDLRIITLDGTPPPRLLVPRGPKVAVQAVWEWLLER